MKKRVCIFMGGRQIGVNCLRTLLKLGVKPELVVPDADDTGENMWYESLLRVAKEKKLSVIVGKKLADQKVVDAIAELKPDVIFCIGSMQLVPKKILQIPNSGVINIHPALLPKYRGRYSTAHAIFNGEKKTGVTLHFMDEGIDSGPIILQKSFPIKPTDTAREVYNRFTRIGTDLFEAFVRRWMLNQPVHATPQDEKKATYYKKKLPNDGKIDWNWGGPKILRFIRAMTFDPFSPIDFQIGKKRMIIAEKKGQKT